MAKIDSEKAKDYIFWTPHPQINPVELKLGLYYNKLEKFENKKKKLKVKILVNEKFSLSYMYWANLYTKVGSKLI